MTIETATGAIQAFVAVFSYTVQVRLKQPSNVVVLHYFREATKMGIFEFRGTFRETLRGTLIPSIKTKCAC